MALLMEFGTANANILTLLTNSNILAFIIPDIQAYAVVMKAKNADTLFGRFRDHIYHLVGLLSNSNYSICR